MPLRQCLELVKPLRQTTPIRIQGKAQIQTATGPLISTQIRPGTITIVQNAAAGTVTVGSTTIKSTPALYPVKGTPQSSQQQSLVSSATLNSSSSTLPSTSPSFTLHSSSSHQTKHNFPNQRN